MMLRVKSAMEEGKWNQKMYMDGNVTLDAGRGPSHEGGDVREETWVNGEEEGNHAAEWCEVGGKGNRWSLRGVWGAEREVPIGTPEH